MKNRLILLSLLFIMFFININSVNALVIDEEESIKVLTLDEAILKVDKHLANFPYSGRSVNINVSNEEDLKALTKLIYVKGISTLSEKAVRGYNRTSGASYYSYKNNDGSYRFVLNIVRDNDINDFVIAEKSIDDIVDYISSSNDLKTDYDILQAVNKYIVLNYEYNLNTDSDYSPYSYEDFLIIKEGVCQAYTALAQELLERFGIETKVILGNDITASSRGSNGLHTWLGVKLGEKWYNFDPTWNDPLNVYNYGDELSYYNTTYLAVSNNFFNSMGYPREIYNPVPADSSYVEYSKSFNLEESKTNYNNNKLNNYFNNYWTLNSVYNNKISFNIMDLSKDSSYNLEITKDGKVFMHIDNNKIEVNNLKNSIDILNYKIINNSNKIRYNNDSLFIDITNKDNLNKTLDGSYILDIQFDNKYRKKLTDNILENPFKDINDRYVTELYSNGLVKGTSTETYSPNNKVNVGQFISIVGRYMGNKDKVLNYYNDFKGHWSENHFYISLKRGLINTEYLSYMKPTSDISRLEVANIIYNTLKYYEVDMPDTNNTTDYKDKLKVNEENYNKLLILKELKIFEGNQLNQFNGNSTLTRLHLAKVIVNTMKVIESN